MSRICMLGHPAAGHTNPTLPIIAELVRRGEQVVYFSSEPFRARVEQTGAEFRAYGAHELFERNLSRGGMLGGMAGLIGTAETILPALLEQVRAVRPDYLLLEAHAVWGNLVAQIVGVPTVTLSSMLAMNERLLTSGQLIEHLYGAAPHAHALAGLHGLSTYFDAARRLCHQYCVNCPGMINYLGNRQALNIVLTSRDFQIGGNAFDESYKFVGPSLPEQIEPHRLPLNTSVGQSLIYISLGTMYNDSLEFYRTCFEAFGRWPAQVVMAVGHRLDRSKLPEPPANFMVRDYVPQLAVLSQASLFLTHGGLNSVHEAMYCGVPMVVLPSQADHHVVANQVHKVGAGVVLNRSEAAPERLAALAERVLGDAGFRRKSAAMGQTLRTAGGCKRAADEILQLKEQERIH
ncbi:MAG TPA: macrolide family glycosyltransferase [Bryobacteraceae bacterium]